MPTTGSSVLRVRKIPCPTCNTPIPLTPTMIEAARRRATTDLTDDQRARVSAVLAAADQPPME